MSKNNNLKHLEGDFQKMLNEIEASYAPRINWLYDKISETRQMMTQFRHDHNNMARELKKFLHNNNLDRVAGFNQFFSQLCKENAHAAKLTREKLAGFQGSFQEMRNSLAQFQRSMAQKRSQAQRTLYGKNITPPESLNEGRERRKKAA